MLALIVLVWTLTVFLILGGFSLIALCILAASMDPMGRSPWATVREGLLVAFAVTIVGFILLALLIWGS